MPEIVRRTQIPSITQVTAIAHMLVTVLLVLAAWSVTSTRVDAEQSQAGSTSAQQPGRAGALEGAVRDRQTRQLVASATVLVENTALATVTDVDGRFHLADVPAGSHVVRVEAAGYAVQSQPDVLVSPGRSSAISLELERSSGTFSEQVVVSASAFDRPPEVTTSSYGMQYAEVRRSAGAIGDINRFVQALPGVIIANDQRNDLVARGGSPSENLTLIDNIEVPNLNHFGAQGTGGGAISMLNTELLADATFLAGGFPAEFGNRLSSVLDIRLREGNRSRTEVEGDVNFAGASLVMEGPLGRKGSWIGTVRRSYLNLLSDVIELPAVPQTTAYQFKGVYEFDAQNKVWLMGLGGWDSILFEVDEADLDDPSLVRVDNDGRRVVTGANWQRGFGKRGYGILSVSDASTRFDVEARDRELDDRVTLLNESHEGETTVKYDVSWQLGRRWAVKGGAAWKRIRSQLDIDQPFGAQNPWSVDPTRVNAVSLHTAFATSIGLGHVQLSGPVAPRLKLTLGGRMDRFNYLDTTTVSPRAGLTFELTPTVTATASFGRYYQQPDLVYLNADPTNRDLDPMRADHVVGGMSYTPRPDLKLSVELYRKAYTSYPVSVEYPTLSLANTGDAFGVGGLLFPMVSAGEGRSRGVELFLHKRLTRGLYGQVSYTFSRTEHAALDGVRRRGAFDAPHAASLIGGYRVGHTWEISSRFTFMSGRPHTPPLLAESEAQNRWIVDLSRVNAERTPSYQRLDLRVDRRFTPGRTYMTLFFEAQNVYNRENVFRYRWNPKTRAPHAELQFGFLPVFGVNVEF
jgi:hypothetical protein